jgi:glycine/D-amino acid oxidase-like deaminating enzyme
VSPRDGGAPDVIVIGGGIVGASAAAFLAGAGARVRLVERNGLASGASGANAGAVWHPIDPVMVGLYAETLRLYRELAAASNAFRIGERPAGLLEVSRSEADVRAEAAAIAAHLPALRPEVLDPAAARDAEPGLADGWWACRLELGYPVAPSSSTYAYASLAEARGATVRAGRAATLLVDGDRVIGVDLDGLRWACGAVIAAAGPWTPALLSPGGSWAPIRPLWGVVAEVELPVPARHIVDEIDGTTAAATVATATAGGERWTRADTADAATETPSPDLVGPSLVPTPGIASIGSTHLAAEPDPWSWVEPILSRAAAILPAVAEAPIRGVRACARPLSLDGRPLVGAVPGLRGAFVCAGHGPWGISTGPASARMVADLVLGRAPSIPADLDPARFGAPSDARRRR